MIFMKCTKTSEAFLRCEELVAEAFVETNFDTFFIQSKRKNIVSVSYCHILLEINLK